MSCCTSKGDPMHRYRSSRPARNAAKALSSTATCRSKSLHASASLRPNEPDSQAAVTRGSVSSTSVIRPRRASRAGVIRQIARPHRRRGHAGSLPHSGTGPSSAAGRSRRTPWPGGPAVAQPRARSRTAVLPTRNDPAEWVDEVGRGADEQTPIIDNFAGSQASGVRCRFSTGCRTIFAGYPNNDSLQS